MHYQGSILSQTCRFWHVPSAQVLFRRKWYCYHNGQRQCYYRFPSETVARLPPKTSSTKNLFSLLLVNVCFIFIRVHWTSDSQHTCSNYQSQTSHWTEFIINFKIFLELTTFLYYDHNDKVRESSPISNQLKSNIKWLNHYYLIFCSSYI